MLILPGWPTRVTGPLIHSYRQQMPGKDRLMRCLQDVWYEQKRFLLHGQREWLNTNASNVSYQTLRNPACAQDSQPNPVCDPVQCELLLCIFCGKYMLPHAVTVQ